MLASGRGSVMFRGTSRFCEKSFKALVDCGGVFSECGQIRTQVAPTVTDSHIESQCKRQCKISRKAAQKLNDHTE